MPSRFVDLSISLENDVLSDPPAFAPKIQYFTHDNTFEQIAPFFPGLKREDLPDGEGWAVELVQLSTHNGTHLDAPYHFHSTMDNALGAKKPAIAIHDVPLEWCFQPAVKLDLRHFADGYVVTGADAWSWDAPFVHTAKKYGQTHDASLIWEGHKAGRDIGYCHIEKLHNLESLPADGFFISCFPYKIRGASAGWTRAVAIFDERLMAG